MPVDSECVFLLFSFFGHFGFLNFDNGSLTCGESYNATSWLLTCHPTKWWVDLFKISPTSTCSIFATDLTVTALFRNAVGLTDLQTFLRSPLSYLIKHRRITPIRLSGREQCQQPPRAIKLEKIHGQPRANKQHSPQLQAVLAIANRSLSHSSKTNWAGNFIWQSLDKV